MLYESFSMLPLGPPQATHASAWRKWEKWVPKVIRMIGFLQNFEFFRKVPDHLKLCFMMCFDALKLWEASWNESEWFPETSFFSWFFSKIWPRNVDFEWACARARSMICQIWVCGSIEHVLKYFWLNSQPKPFHRCWDFSQTLLKVEKKRGFPFKMSQFLKIKTSSALPLY